MLPTHTGRRAFPAHVSLLSEPNAARPQAAHFDVVLVADFCLDGKNATRQVKQIQSHLDQGQRVAICQVRSYQEVAWRRFIHMDIQRFVNEGKVAQIDLAEEATCSRLLVLTPSFLEHARHLESQIRTGNLEIVPLMPVEEEAPDRLPRIQAIARQEAARLFGSRTHLPLPLKPKIIQPVAPASVPTILQEETHAPVSDYWGKRRHLIYYQVIRVIAEQLSIGAKSVVDVGSNKCPYLEWLGHVPLRTSIDLYHPYVSPGIESIKQNFLTWKPDRKYDVALCLQVLEHVRNAGTFAQKLLEVAKIVVVSVPYKWPVGYVKGHVHDPVDESKMTSWFGRRPNYKYLCREVVSGQSRLIQVYEHNNDQWHSLRQRSRLQHGRTAPDDVPK